MIRSLIAAAALCFLPAVAPAQVLLTLTGTVKSSYLPEYTVGSTFSLYFQLAPFLPPTGGASDFPDSEYYEWIEEVAVDSTLYTAVWFTGSTGTWQRPEGDNNESLVGIYQNSIGTVITVETASDTDNPGTPSSMGLFAGGDQVTIILTTGVYDLSPFTPTFSATLPQVLDYWAQYDGHTFPQTNASWESFITTVNGNIVVNIESLTVAVPEPTTTAMLAASAVIGLILLRRRRSIA